MFSEMKQHSLKFNGYQRWLAWLGGGSLFVSGMCWTLLKSDVGARFATLKEFAPWLLKLHGFAAVSFVFLLGTLVPSHIRRSLGADKNRTNGFLVIGAVSVSVLTGYSLYYLGDEAWRERAGSIHFWLGACMPVVLVLHMVLGRRAVALGEASSGEDS